MVPILRIVALAGVLSAVASAAKPGRLHPRDRQAVRSSEILHRQATAQNETDARVIQGVYMVELEDAMTPDQLVEELSSESGVTIQIRRPLTSKIFNGVSIEVLNAGSAAGGAKAAILAADAVKQVWPVRAVSMPADDTRSFINLNEAANFKARRDVGDSYYPHVMSQVDLLHKAGFKGQGIRIGVVDTGIDYTHPILGGCLGPGCVVTHGWDSVGYDEVIGQIPAPDDDPMDCAGHGTHVAGIISALPNEFGFTGVAPDARLGAYRVLDCFGWGTEETIAAGMLRAFDDGNDIITMSVSVSGGLPDSLLSLTATRIIEAGVPVFVAIANTGEYGSMFDPVSPADGRLVSSISSFDPVQEPSVYAMAEYVIGDAEPQEFGWVPLLNGRYEFASGADQETFPLIDLNHFVVGDTAVTGCQRLPESVPDLTGYLVLVERSPQDGCLFRTQRESIVARGGTNMIFWGTEELIRNIINDDLKSFIATTTTSPAKEWREALATGSNVTVTMTVPFKSRPSITWTTNNETGGAVSSYSSWGPTYDLRSAPSFGGPGRSIMSTYLRNGQGVATLGGTSMAAPFVAGAAALLSQARGTLDPHTLQVLLASTAVQPRGPHHPMQAGAGLIQLWDAAQAKGVLSVPSISFNDSDHHLDEVTFTLRNVGSADAVYQLGHMAMATIYAMGRDGSLARVPLDRVDATAGITFVADKVSVLAGGEAEITVRCTQPRGVDGGRWPIYSGYITLNGTNGDALTIPYIGNAGSMHEGTIITEDNIFIFPRFDAEDVVTLPRPGDTPSDEPSWDDLSVTAMTTLPTRVLRIDIVVPPPIAGSNGTAVAPVNGTTSYGHPRAEWLGRKSYGQIWGSPYAALSAVMGSSITWAGFLADGRPLPEGRYAILISALRLFAEPDSEDVEDWQTVETVPFVLRYQE